MHNHRNHTIVTALAGFIVLAALGVPVPSSLPLIALVALCPLMMLFMMRGMNHGSGTTRGNDHDRVNPHQHSSR